MAGRKNEKFFVDTNEKKFRSLGYTFRFIDVDDLEEAELAGWVEPIELGIKQDDIILPQDKEVDYTIGRNRMIVVRDSIWRMSKFWWLDKLYMILFLIFQIALYIFGFKLFR